MTPEQLLLRLRGRRLDGTSDEQAMREAADLIEAYRDQILRLQSENREFSAKVQHYGLGDQR